MKALAVIDCVELSTESSFQQEVKILVLIVCSMKLDNKGRVAHLQNVLFVDDVLLTARLHYVSFVQALESISFLCRLVLIQFNHAKAAATEKTDLFELTQWHTASAR